MGYLRLSICIFLIIIIGCNTGHKTENNSKEPLFSPIEQVRDRNLDPAILSKILAFSGPNSFKPCELSSIVNDTSYNPVHRRKCLFYLFSNYVRTPITLDSMAKVIGKMDWISEQNVVWIPRHTGLKPGDEAFDIAISPRMPTENRSTICLGLGFNEKYFHPKFMWPGDAWTFLKMSGISESIPEKYLLKLLKADSTISKEMLKNITIKIVAIFQDSSSSH
jgi:hypothetical protein